VAPPVSFIPSTQAPTHVGRFRDPVVPTLGPFCFYNNAEGGTDAGGVGTTVTAGNSGGLSGTAAQTVTIGAGASLIFDNAHVAHGSYSYRFATGGTAVQSFLRWELATFINPKPAVFYRVDMFTPAGFTVAQMLSRLQSSAGDVARLTFNTSGNLLIRDASTGIVATSTTVFNTSSPYRIEAYQAVGANALSTIRIYDSYDAPIGAFIEELSVNANFGTVNIEQFSIGQAAALANVPQWWADDIGLCDTDWLGPVGPDMAPAPVPARRRPYPLLRHNNLTRTQLPTLTQDTPILSPTVRRRGTVPRHRPDTFEPPWLTVTPPPGFIPQPVKDRARQLRRKATSAVTPPAGQNTPPDVLSGLRRRNRPVRRARISEPTPPQFNPPQAPPPVGQVSKMLRRIRRQTVFPTPAQAAPTPPPYPPQQSSALARALRRIRRQTVTPVRGQVNPPFPPQTKPSRVRRLPGRRHFTAFTVPAQLAATDFIRVRSFSRTKLAKAKSRITPVPFTTTQAGMVLSGRRRIQLRVWPTVVTPPADQAPPPAPPPYVPPPVRAWMRESQLARPRTATPVPPQIIVIEPDHIFEPLLDTALRCLCEAVAQLPVPPSECCHRSGDHVTFDVTECCNGLAWVRFVSAVSTDEESFPGGREDIEVCELPVREWSVQVELGIGRCAPVGTPDLLPTCVEWQQALQTGLLDLMALRIATCCITDDFRYRDLIVDELTVHGPSGGCTDTTMTIFVKVVSCDECD
jgi:hypothetical protein